MAANAIAAIDYMSSFLSALRPIRMTAAPKLMNPSLSQKGKASARAGCATCSVEWDSLGRSDIGFKASSTSELHLAT